MYFKLVMIKERTVHYAKYKKYSGPKDWQNFKIVPKLVFDNFNMGKIHFCSNLGGPKF